MNVGQLIPMTSLAEAIKNNVDTMPQKEAFSELDAAAVKPALDGLVKKSLEDLEFHQEALGRMSDLFKHDNSDVWDAHVARMADEGGATAESVRDLDATIRELGNNPDSATEELDAYVANIAAGQSIPGGLSGLLGTKLLKDADGAMHNMLESMREMLEKTGELTGADIDAAVDAVANIGLESDDVVAVALADPADHHDVFEAEPIDTDDDVVEAESADYDNIQDDQFNDATA